MINLFKRTLKPTFFAVLKQILDAQKAAAGKADPDPLVSHLWRDALNRAPDCDPPSMQLVIENLAKFAEVVYYSDYSYEMITCESKSSCLTRCGRRSDGEAQSPDNK